MPNDSGKWKSKLLSSSLPLEFQVAKFLAAREYAVTADYPYQREDAGVRKEFSVDVHAFNVLPSVEEVGSSCSIDILVECKHRHAGTIWLFLPDPNRPDLSSATWGTSIRAIDAFSRWFFQESTYPFDATLARAYKGVEVDVSSGSVHDSELRHGVAQLQYAIPPLLADKIETAAFAHPVDNTPFVFTAILVTNAPLILAHKGFDIGRVAAATSVRDFGREVPYLTLLVAAGPELRSHIAYHCRGLPKVMSTEAIQIAETHRKSEEVPDDNLPTATADSLARGGTFIGASEVTNHVIVCNAANFKTLISHVERLAKRLNRKMKLRKKRWRWERTRPNAG